jgi:hypothetical protein
MSIINMSDITPAGAFCNATAAARESDRRAARSRPSVSFEATMRAPATIWNFLGDALRQIGLTYRTETV